MCSLFFLYFIFQITYRTSEQNIQILRYTRLMGILDNFESAIWNAESQNDGLALKIFSETCCNGCSCKSESDHEPSTNTLNNKL